MTPGEPNNENMRPPAYLQEKLDDLLQPVHPRLVVVTHRVWMEPYHALEERELRARLTAGRAQYGPLVLWLREIRLFSAAFSRGYDWSHEPDREAGQTIAFRLDLLGLAGGNSKLALDALMAGYYSGCMALERHMLETWRRVAYARLSSQDIWRWYPQHMWPALTPAQKKAMPTRYPDAKQIAEKIQACGTVRDRRLLDKVQGGFKTLTDHAHPTIEGATQTWHESDPDRRIFGPTFSDPHARRCLKWGLAAGAMLLGEIAMIDAQRDAWRAELASIEEQLASWLQRHQD